MGFKGNTALGMLGPGGGEGTGISEPINIHPGGVLPTPEYLTPEPQDSGFTIPGLTYSGEPVTSNEFETFFPSANMTGLEYMKAQNRFNSIWEAAGQDARFSSAERSEVIAAHSELPWGSLASITGVMDEVNRRYLEANSDKGGMGGMKGETRMQEGTPPPPDPSLVDITTISGVQDIPAPQMNLGISNAAVGSRSELQSMLATYKSRTLNIQSLQRQKAMYTIDRFDGGLNLNKSPRDLSYWEACQSDELSPSKVGRLIRLGDFTSEIAYNMGLNGAEQENYGLHYFRWSDSVNTDSSFDGSAPANYLAYTSGDGGVDLWNFRDAGGAAKLEAVVAASKFDNAYKPVYHDADNRLYISDANLSQTSSKDKTMVCGIVDRRDFFPFDDSGTLTYNITGNSQIFKSQPLYHAPPTKGVGSGHVMVTGTQLNESNTIGGNSIAGFSNTQDDPGGTYPNGIYININFENISGDEASSTGWGADTPNTSSETAPGTGTKYYKIYASFLYDNGSETKLTDVTSNDNAVGDDVVKATTTQTSKYQKMVIKQVLIDGEGIVAALPRVHGARFYYNEVNASGDTLGGDKYQWAELDFRYGFKLVSEFGHWNQFEDDNGTTDGSTVSDTQSIQVLGAANSGTGTEADTATGNFGTLSITEPPIAFTFFINNIFHPEEMKDDLMWKTSTVGNGIALVGNIKYDGREYPDTMLYSVAGLADSGYVYPMWGTFPVDSNRIDIPGTSGEITALQWTSGRILQFRKNSLYVINVEDVVSPIVEAVHQGMGVAGPYAVTETPYGVAWVNENGVYAYNAEENKTRSLTIGRLDAEDFGANSNSKIGYDDRAKMLIIGNYTLRATGGYHYAYSFVTDAWCTWNTNAATLTAISNFAINHDGYLTGGTADGTSLDVRKWSAEAQGNVAVDYITKDIDFGKPNLDKRFYTLYISYTGGGGNAVKVYFRPNGKDGAFLGAHTIWYELKTLQDYTNPYGSAGVGGDGNVSISTTSSLSSTVEPSAINNQRLAKINLRTFATDTTNIELNSGAHGLPPDYFRWIRSIQLRFKGEAAETFEINDISLVFKEKRLK